MEEQSKTLKSSPQFSTASAAATTASTSLELHDPQQIMSAQTSEEPIEPWAFVTTALIFAVIAGQPHPRDAAMIISEIFKPVIDGCTATRFELQETKRPHEQAQAQMAGLQFNKAEMLERHKKLQSQAQSKEQRLAEAERQLRAKAEEASTLSRVLGEKRRESEAETKRWAAEIAEVEREVARAEGGGEEAGEVGKKAKWEADQKKREVGSSARRLSETEVQRRKLREELQKAEMLGGEEITKMEEKLQEADRSIADLQEEERKTSANVTSLEQQLQQKSAENESLESRLAGVNSRRDALQQQLAAYSRLYPPPRPQSH